MQRPRPASFRLTFPDPGRRSPEHTDSQTARQPDRESDSENEPETLCAENLGNKQGEAMRGKISGSTATRNPWIPPLLGEGFKKTQPHLFSLPLPNSDDNAPRTCSFSRTFVADTDTDALGLIG